MAADTREEIMEATYRALCEHGYAALTMQDIADEFDRSKSSLHYHYDTKGELLVAFIDHILADFEERVEESEGAPPDERLAAFVDWFVFGPDEADRERFHVALLELRAQGPFNEAYREQLRRSDDLLVDTVAEILEDGIETGVFAETDPEATATLLVAALDGARTRQITLEDPTYTDRVRETLVDRVIAPLLRDSSAEAFAELGRCSDVFDPEETTSGDDTGVDRGTNRTDMDTTGED
jgi:AcrR family transcriptional regulator